MKFELVRFLSCKKLNHLEQHLDCILLWSKELALAQVWKSTIFAILRKSPLAEAQTGSNLAHQAEARVALFYIEPTFGTHTLFMQWRVVETVVVYII